jgi:enoyl-[acyl-carrier protein] reductase I
MSELMRGKRGLVMGVAHDHTIAWGSATALHAEGAGLAFSYQGEPFRHRVAPLAESLGSRLLLDVDVTDDASLDAAFRQLKDDWGSIDFLIHAIAYSDKNELSGRFINTSRENFKTSMLITCYSLIDLCRRAAPIMPKGGSVITLTFQGSRAVMPYYNVMGVAKAGLEAAVRYLANDLGPDGIRVNAISPGPMRTLAGAAIGGARKTFRATEANAPLRANPTLEAVGGTAAWLCSDYAASTSGEIIHVDGGYHVMGMAQPDNL